MDEVQILKFLEYGGQIMVLTQLITLRHTVPLVIRLWHCGQGKPDMDQITGCSHIDTCIL